MALFAWNPKCVIQGLVVIGAWVYFDHEGGVPAVEFDEWTWWLTAALVVFAVYFGNAFLDLAFGCEHGQIYQRLFGFTK